MSKGAVIMNRIHKSEDRSLLHVAIHFPVKEFDKGETLFNEGAEITKCFVVKKGYVKVVSFNENGVPQVLWIAGSGDIVPAENFFVAKTATHFFYIALTNVAVYEVDKHILIADAKEDSDVMAGIARTLANYSDTLLARLHAVEQPNVRIKILYSLYDLATRLSAKDKVDLYALGLTLTHQDIADMVGASRETTSLELMKLRSQKLLTYNRQELTVHVKKIAALISTRALL